MVASPPAPLAQTLSATAILDTGATLNGSVNANASATTVTMVYGLTAAYGETVIPTPASALGHHGHRGIFCARQSEIGHHLSLSGRGRQRGRHDGWQ